MKRHYNPECFSQCKVWVENVLLLDERHLAAKSFVDGDAVLRHGARVEFLATCDCIQQRCLARPWLETFNFNFKAADLQNILEYH